MYVSGLKIFGMMYFIKFAFNLIKELLTCRIITVVIIIATILIIATIIISTKTNARNPLMKSTEIIFSNTFNHNGYYHIFSGKC